MGENANLKEIGANLNAVVGDRKKIDAAITEIQKALDAAGNDEDDIDFNLKRLVSLEKVIAKAVARAQNVMGELRMLAMNEAFIAANGSKMAPLVDLGSKQLKAITAAFAKVKQMEKDTAKAGAAAKDVVETARERMARIVDSVADDRSGLKEMFNKADAVLQRAASAADQRNTAALKKAKDDFRALGTFVSISLHEGIVKSVDEFERDAKDKELASIADELKGDIADVRADLKGNEIWVEQLKRAQTTMDDTEIAAPNLAKAAKLLSIDRAGEKALGEALKLDLKQMEIKLNPIGAKMSKKMTGRAIIALLRQNGVI